MGVGRQGKRRKERNDFGQQNQRVFVGIDRQLYPTTYKIIAKDSENFVLTACRINTDLKLVAQRQSSYQFHS